MPLRRKLLTLSLASATGAAAQTWPQRPVHLVVPSAPGGPSGDAAQALLPALVRRWKQQVHLEHIAGEGTVKATASIARSQADGYRIALATTALSINAALRHSLPYSTLQDLTPVCELAGYQFALFAHRSVPVRTMGDFIAYARRSSSPLLYAAPGLGTGSHLAAEAFAFEAGIRLKVVQFDGSAPAEQAVQAGRLPFVVMGLTCTIAAALKKPLRIVGLMGKKGADGASSVSWASDLVPGFEVDGSVGVIAPAGLSPAVLERLAQDFTTVVRQADVREAFAHIGMACTGTSASQYESQIRADIAQWRLAGRVAGVTLD